MLNLLQNNLLSMMSWFHGFCVKNDITYYAAGGTVLGAVRHGGFIPWDDDIDVVLPRDDYNRLIKLLKNKVIDHYILESPYDNNSDYLYSYSKLYDINTTLVENTKYTCQRGVFIDVFPLDNLDNSYKESLKRYKTVDRRNMFLMMRTCKIRRERSFFKNLSIFFASLIPNMLIDNKQLSIELDRYCQNIGISNSIYVGNLMGAYRKKEIIQKNVFGKPILHKFENIEIYIPERYIYYLELIYDKWDILPPKEMQKSNHNYKILDLTIPYKKYKN